MDKLLTISQNRPTRHLDRPERKAVNNLADSSIENTQVDSRRVVNKGSDDLELGLSVTKNKPAGVGALLSGAQGWRITE